jgi:membrane-associated phospholipid phosphatase
MKAMRVRGVRATCLFFILGAGAANLSRAQDASPAPSARVFTSRDAAILGGATLGAVGVSLFDVRIARFFAKPELHTKRRFQVIAKRTSLVTETLLMLSGSSIWALARVGHSAGTADVALHTTESVASGAGFIQIIRGIGGRARPYVVTDSGETRDSQPYDFELFKGFTSFDYRSFPSMHAMASFAAATALSQEMRVRNTRGRQVLSPMLYVAATASPFARLYLDEHWASDIALGAFLGIYAGQKVVIYSHEHPRSRIDRVFLKPQTRIGVILDASGASLRVWPF